MVEVTLTAYELEMAAIQGMRRQIEAVQKGLGHIAGYEGIGWDIHIEGAAGELAFAKSINRYWSGSVNTFKTGGDVGSVQVRTRSKHSYELLVRDQDRDDDLFVLVTGVSPNFKVWGYITGREAKQGQWRQTHGGRPPAYFVPHAALTPLVPVTKAPSESSG